MTALLEQLPQFCGSLSAGTGTTKMGLLTPYCQRSAVCPCFQREITRTSPENSLKTVGVAYDWSKIDSGEHVWQSDLTPARREIGESTRNMAKTHSKLWEFAKVAALDAL